MFHSKQDVDRHVTEVFRNIESEYQRNLKCYQIAKLYFKFKDYKSAIKYVNRYILTTSNSAAAHRLLGECYLGFDLKVKALESFKTSLVLNGSQHDLVLKICTLLMDPDVAAVTPRAAYWLERAESLFPTNPIVFQLKEHLLKSNLGDKQDNGQLEKLILSEISARPTDVTVRIRLLNFFMDTKRYKIAYQHALEIEQRKTFSKDLRWYDCLCNLMQAYEKVNSDLGFSFFIKKIIFLERRADLFMQEFQEEIKTLPECSAALFAFDQNLQSVSKIEVSQEETLYFNEFMKHMRAQLSFHLATLALKRAKKEYGIWPKAFRTASPLLLQATQTTMDLEEPWYNTAIGKNKLDGEVKQLNKSANLRISQAGHILLAWSQSKGPKFLEKVSQFCGGKWQNHAYQDIFYNKEHQQALTTSHFVNDPFFTSVPMRLLSEAELVVFDEVSQSAFPDSLHHLVWLGLSYCNTNGQLSHDFRCVIVPDLQFTVANLSQTGAETLNQLDVDAFLYASVLCAKSAMRNVTSSDRPSKLPISISEELCSVAQAEWWLAVNKSYTNQITENVAQMRLTIRKGIETVRVCGQHGLHIKVIVMLAKLFQERAVKSKNINEINGLEDRAHLYWSAAIPALEKIEKNQQVREVPNRLFDYRGKDLTANEIKGYLEDGKLFLACRLMKQGKHDQAIEAFQSLKSPFATFYQALIYEKLASEEVNHRPESITSENRSQHIILLTRARDAFYLTLDRLRCPSVDPNHPLNSQLQDHLEQVEKQLAVIDPDNTLNRNGESVSDETDTAPGPLSPDVDENMDSSFNVFNTSNFLNVKNNSALRSLRPGKHNVRYEARPSPERLDAQLRHLVQANSNGLHAIVEQLKEMKSAMQIELKDLGCVTRDLLAEMKRWNDKLEAMSKRATDVVKPENLFEFREEDYDDFGQLSQPYTSYQNYSMNRQMPGTQGTSTVTYGTSVPSPVPSVPPVMPTPENPLIPPTFYSGAHSVPPLDPSLLLYQSLGYYAPGMPYVDNQNVGDYRVAGIQKGASLVKNSFKATDVVTTASLTTKPESPNVVITSSDILPAFTNAGTPAMSVLIPPHHIRGPVPLTTQKPPPGQTFTYPIPMPPQAQLVKESPAEKLNALTTTTSVTMSPIQTALISSKKPSVQPANLQKENQPKSVSEQLILEPKLEKNKLFESHGQLAVFEKKWTEKGNVLIKVIHDDKLGKVKITMIQEPGALVLADHYIAPNTALEPQNDENVWTWSVSNLHEADIKLKETAGMKMTWRKLRVKFQSLDEAKDFEFAFNEGRRIVKEGNPEGEAAKSTFPADLKTKECKTCNECKGPVEGNAEECSVCQNKKKSNSNSNLKGFTFNSPILKPPILSVNQTKEKPKDTANLNLFKEFTFSTATTTSAKSVSQPNSFTSTLSDGLFTSTTTCENFFSGVKPDPNSFKKDKNKEFEGKDSLVFGHLKPKKPDESAVKNKKDEDDDDEDEVEEYVVKDDFKPIIDLPAYVDVKTGEENDTVLYDERAKLLRFDTELKEWKERGIGQMKVLLNKESGKVRLIMRRELVLKVCCNHYLDANMEFKRMTKSEKALTWHAQDYSEGELKSEFLALKFANPDSMIRFETAVKNAQSEMKNGRIKENESNVPLQEQPKDMKPLSEQFRPKPGTWECTTCLIRNEEFAMKCVSCESPKPGTESSVTPSNNSNLGKGITLTPVSNFTFGIPQSTSVTPTVSNAATIFGGSASQNTVSGTSFTFGKPQLNTNTSSNSAKFIFGSPSTKLPSDFSAKFSAKNAEGSVSTNSTPFSATTFTFGVPNLNVTSANTKVDAMPGPTVTDSVAETKTSPVVSFPLSAPKFTFTTSNTPVTTSEGASIFGGSKFTFGVSKVDEKKDDQSVKSKFSFSTALKPEGKEKFEFSLSNIKPSIPKVSTSPKYGASQEAGSSEDTEEEFEVNEDHNIVKPVVPLPEKVPEHTGEEDEDVLYQNRAKLYRFIDKEWKERGLGDIKILKHKTNNKIRLLMRRETILKVCLNHFVTSDIQFNPKDEKSWTWTAPDFSEEEVRYDTFAIRFKTPEIATEFKKVLDEVKNTSVSTSPSKPVAAEKSKEPTKATKNFIFGNAAEKSPPQGSLSGPGDEDVLVIYENKVTPEQQEKAMSLHLPPKFYAYLQTPDCPGCPGCPGPDDHDVPDLTQQNSPPSAMKNSVSENKPWGSLNFGKDSGSDEKVLFTFAGNQPSPMPLQFSKGGSRLMEKNKVDEYEEEEEEEEEDDDNDDEEDEEEEQEEEEDEDKEIEEDENEEIEEDENEEIEEDENEDEDEDDEDKEREDGDEN